MFINDSFLWLCTIVYLSCNKLLFCSGLFCSVQVLPDDSEYDLWISISKRFTSLDENLILCTLYIPPENSRFLNEEHYSLLENEISSKCAEYKYIYHAGDTNSRVGTMPDFLRPDPHLNEIVEIDDDTQIYLHKCKTLEDLSFNLERNS